MQPITITRKSVARTCPSCLLIILWVVVFNIAIGLLALYEAYTRMKKTIMGSYTRDILGSCDVVGYTNIGWPKRSVTQEWRRQFETIPKSTISNNKLLLSEDVLCLLGCLLVKQTIIKIATKHKCKDSNPSKPVSYCCYIRRLSLHLPLSFTHLALYPRRML